MPTGAEVTFRGSVKDASGVTVAGDKKLLDAARSRQYILFQNLSAADMYLNFGGAATGGQGSIRIAAGEVRQWHAGLFVPTDALHVYAAAAGGVYTLKHS